MNNSDIKYISTAIVFTERLLKDFRAILKYDGEFCDEFTISINKNILKPLYEAREDVLNNVDKYEALKRDVILKLARAKWWNKFYYTLRFEYYKRKYFNACGILYWCDKNIKELELENDRILNINEN